jgi:4a-hydroxytetrahydrobiopterin dehydratase
MQPLDVQTISSYIAQKLHLPWELIDQKYLRVQLEFEHFDESIACINHIAKIANRLNHHPNIHVYYNVVLLDITTHDAQGITHKDLQLATEIEKII